ERSLIFEFTLPNPKPVYRNEPDTTAKSASLAFSTVFIAQPAVRSKSVMRSSFAHKHTECDFRSGDFGLRTPIIITRTWVRSGRPKTRNLCRPSTLGPLSG